MTCEANGKIAKITPFLREMNKKTGLILYRKYACNFNFKSLKLYITSEPLFRGHTDERPTRGSSITRHGCR